MAEQEHKSVFTFEVQNERAKDALDQILTYLEQIQGATDATAASLDMVIDRGGGEIASLRVSGIDELNTELKAISSTMQGLRRDLRDGTASMGQIGTVALTSASEVQQLDQRLMELQARLQQSQRVMGRLQGTEIGGLIRGYGAEMDDPSTGAQAARGYDLTVESLDELSDSALTATTNLKLMVTEQGNIDLSLSSGQIAMMDYYQAVESGSDTVNNAGDALQYLAGEQIAFSIGLGSMTEDQLRMRNAIEQYSEALLEQREVVQEIASTETILESTRETREEQLLNEKSALDDVVQGLKDMTDAIKETMEAGPEGDLTATLEGATEVTATLAEGELDVQEATEESNEAIEEQIKILQELQASMKAANEEAKSLAEQQQEVAEEVGGRGAGDGGRRVRPTTPTPAGGEEDEGFFDKFTSGLQVHFRWMLRYLILWKGMQVVKNIAKEWFEVNIQLDYSLTLLNVSLSGNIGLMREYEDALYGAARASAQLPSEMAVPTLMTARMYEPEQAEAMMTMGGQLATLTQGDPTEATRALILIQRQLGLSVEETQSILDALAGSLRNTHLLYSELLPLLRRAAEYSQRYNMTIEETIGLQAGVMAATGASATEVDGMMRRLTEFYEVGSKSNVMLNNMGINIVQVTEDGTKLYRPLIDVMREIAVAVEGDEQALSNLSDTAFRTGSVHRATFQTAIRDVDTLNQSYNDAVYSAGEFDRNIEGISETWTVTIRGMKSSWEELLSALKMDPALIGQLDGVSGALSTLAQRMIEAQRAAADAAADAKAQGGFFGQLVEWGDQPNVKFMLGNIPRDIATVAKRMGLIPEQVAPQADADEIWGIAGLDFPGIGGGGRAGPPLPKALDITTPVAELPKGLGMQELVDDMRVIEQDWVGVFTDGMGQQYEITQNDMEMAREQIMVWDEATNEFRLVMAYMPALRRAISENTEELRLARPQLRHIEFDPVRYSAAINRLVQHYDRISKDLGFDEEPRVQLLWGPGDQVERILAGDTALGLAMHALQEAVEENTDAMIEGMWNIPEGQQIWVPLTSITQARLADEPSGRGGLSEADIDALVNDIIKTPGRLPGPLGMGEEDLPYKTFLPSIGGGGGGATLDLDRSASDLASASGDLRSAAEDMSTEIGYMNATIAYAVINASVPYLPPIAKMSYRTPEPTPQSSRTSLDGEPVRVSVSVNLDGSVIGDFIRETVFESL